MSDVGCDMPRIRTEFAHRGLLCANSVKRRMGAVGNAYGNAIVEHFFATLECAFDMLSAVKCPSNSALVKLVCKHPSYLYSEIYLLLL